MSTRSRPYGTAPARVGTAARASPPASSGDGPVTTLRTLGAGVIATLGVALLATLGVAVIGGPRAAAASRAAAPFVLDGQSEWVVAPRSPTGAARFDLGLTARDVPARAVVDVVLYPRLRSRYAFKSVVRNGPRGSPLTTTTPVAYDSLPADAGTAGAVSLDLSVLQTSSTGAGTRIGLACAPPTGAGTCTGVYPVTVELERSNGKVLHHFTTFLTYVAGKSAHPLELAWVVPVQSSVSLSRHPSGPADGIEPLGSAPASALETLVAQLHGSAVPVTLEPSPEILQQLDHAGPAGRAADATLAGLSADPATDELLASPYVPVDLGALSGAGEPTEIVAQMAAGATVFRQLRVEPSLAPSPWVQRGPVGDDIATGLTEVGATQLVLPDTDLAPTSSTTSSGTWVSTFSLTLSHGGRATRFQAAETDTWLDGQFTSLRNDPALAATQLLADLAMVHFERPNTTAVRGMVALPPSSWVANHVFDQVLLDGLSQDPVVEPVTLSHFFGSVTADGARQLRTSGSGPVLEHSLARAVSRARVRLSSFDDAVVGRPAVLAELDHILLATEAEDLTARRQAAGVSTFEHVLGGQLGLVTFAKTTTVTLTARTGWIPVTIDSRAPYAMTGRLSVSGNKFVFLHERNPLRKLDHATTVSRVDVRARTSGDLPLDVELTSPDGQLVIARGLITVRSTATSLVGIVLTVVALCVLLVWWARSWRSGRRKRRLRRAGELGGGASAP